MSFFFYNLQCSKLSLLGLEPRTPRLIGCSIFKILNILSIELDILISYP